MKKNLKLQATAITDKGIKKERNEDCILANSGEWTHGSVGLFVVADGVGGTDDGCRASNIVVEKLNGWWDKELPLLLRNNTSMTSIINSLKVEIEMANWEILQECKDREMSMATTASVLFVLGEDAGIIHIGDSRIYMLSPKRVCLLTEDHTWVNEQVRKERMTVEQALVHKKRHAITRCVGHDEQCLLDSMLIKIKPGQQYVLCSDGFYNYYTKEEMQRRFYCKQIDDNEKNELLKTMVSEIYVKGAHDNISVIVVKIGREREGLAFWRR